MSKLISIIFTGFMMLVLWTSSLFAEVICNKTYHISNVRQGPSAKNYPIVASLKNGARVIVLKQITNDEGYKYYHIKFRVKSPSSGNPVFQTGYVFHELLNKADVCKTNQVAQKNTNQRKHALPSSIVSKKSFPEIWSGLGVQNDGSKWPVEVIFSGKNAKVKYPSLNCSGIWHRKNQVKGQIVYLEKIIRGKGRCMDNVDVSLKPAGRGKMKLHYSKRGNHLATAFAVLEPGAYKKVKHDTKKKNVSTKLTDQNRSAELNTEQLPDTPASALKLMQFFDAFSRVGKIDPSINSKDVLLRQATETSAKDGEPISMLIIAIMYEKNDSNENNLFLAKSWYEKAIYTLTQLANKGDPDTMLALAKMYEHGFGVEKNSKQSLLWYQKAFQQFRKLTKAEESHVQIYSMVSLGIMYDMGMGVNVDKSKSTYWFTEASKIGGTSTLWKIAKMYTKGEHVQKSKSQANLWNRKLANLYEVEANRGNLKSMRALANMYVEGKKIDKDPQKAFEWSEKAAKKGDEGAMYLLAQMYDQGQGVDKNTEKAIKWYEKAAKKGNESALLNLTVRFFENKQLEKAVYWAERARGINNNQMQMFMILSKNLAVEYINGTDNRKKDINKGIQILKNTISKWKEKKDNQSLRADVFFVKAIAHAKKNESKNILVSLKKASDIGHKGAKCHLANYYEEGVLVTKNLKKAQQLRKLGNCK